MEQTKHPKNVLGSVPGKAGRPRTVARKITIGLPEDALQIYDSYIHKTAFVADALLYYHRYLRGRSAEERRMTINAIHPALLLRWGVMLILKFMR